MDERRKKILYRSMHRGCKETDIILGSFALANIAILSEYELNDYEKITECDDSDLYKYLTGHSNPLQHLNAEMLKRIAVWKAISQKI